MNWDKPQIRLTAWQNCVSSSTAPMGRSTTTHCAQPQSAQPAPSYNCHSDTHSWGPTSLHATQAPYRPPKQRHAPQTAFSAVTGVHQSVHASGNAPVFASTSTFDLLLRYPLMYLLLMATVSMHSSSSMSGEAPCCTNTPRMTSRGTCSAVFSSHCGRRMS